MDLHPDIAHKIIDAPALMARIKHWRAVGNTIVFTNGCFDLLHRGHVELLAQCRDMGDYVIVGLNTDRSVKKLKGPTRPVNDELSRAAVLAALKYADAVVLFDEDTPLELISLIKPDILVKGGDYKAADIVGADLLRSYGGEVRIVPLVKGFSTTETIARSGQ